MMAKNLFSIEYKDGDSVDDQFIVSSKNLKKTKDGESYIQLLLKDRMGEIKGLFWNSGEKEFQEINLGEVYRVIGEVKSFYDEKSIHIKSISKVPREEILVSDFLKSSRTPKEELKRKVLDLIDSVSDDEYKKVLKEIFSSEALEKFVQSPAGKRNHHNYIGGLADHTISVSETAEFLSKKYNLNRDLLISGVLLHDIGKIYELFFNYEIDYSTMGRLIGHITIGAAIVQEVCNRLGVSEIKRDFLTHMIVSHHENPEYGSPKPPMIKEAQALAFIDDLDAKMYQFWELEDLVESDDGWSPWSKILDRSIFSTKSTCNKKVVDEKSKNKPLKNLENENLDEELKFKQNKNNTFNPKDDGLFKLF